MRHVDHTASGRQAMAAQLGPWGKFPHRALPGFETHLHFEFAVEKLVHRSASARATRVPVVAKEHDSARLQQRIEELAGSLDRLINVAVNKL